ncbi:unnamed protein product [Rhizophagus irregularis]|nr:unnamed protein product [Rhizophagus irregularis]
MEDGVTKSFRKDNESCDHPLNIYKKRSEASTAVMQQITVQPAATAASKAWEQSMFEVTPGKLGVVGRELINLIVQSVTPLLHIPIKL